MHSRLRRIQLRTRVLIGVVLITMAALAAFDVAAVSALRGYLIGRTDSTLETALRETQPRLLRLIPVVETLGKPRRIEVPVYGQYNISWWSPQGSRIVLEEGVGVATAGWVNLRAPVARPAAFTVYGPRGQSAAREQAMTVAEGGTLVASTSLGNVNQTVGRLELIVVIGSIAACLLVFLGVGLVMRRGLRPIEAMAAQADRISAGDLTDRVSPQNPRSEVGRLGSALNGMLARIEASVQEREASQEFLRRFFADASHELRTPLASLRANAELYQQGALPERPQVDEAMRRIALESQRMSSLVDDMLRLARLDQHPGQEREPVDLSELTLDCVQRAKIADPRRTWQTRVDDGVVVIGDEELLRRAIDNLLANVAAHTPDDAIATVTVAESAGTDGGVLVAVSDDGPGVPPDQLPHIFDRFYRAAAPSYRPGSGLGLAIVTAIAAAHDGAAAAAQNEPHGLRVTITLRPMAIAD
jgi:two-component system OmpR family sensor kinase